jgi:hypothetical protein
VDWIYFGHGRDRRRALFNSKNNKKKIKINFGPHKRRVIFEELTNYWFQGWLVVTLEGLTTINSNFWSMTPCYHVDCYRSFGGTFCLHLQGRRVLYCTIRLDSSVLDYTASHLSRQLISSFTVKF